MVTDVLAPTRHQAISNHHTVSSATTDCDNSHKPNYTRNITCYNHKRNNAREVGRSLTRLFLCYWIDATVCVGRLLVAICPHGLTLIAAWISNHTSSKVWDEINHQFPNFNGATIEVWDWISNFISHYWMYEYLSILRLKLNHVSKRATVRHGGILTA